VTTNILSIEAPLTGTFYASPSPEEPSYVEVGQSINEGDVVCIIESMKVFTEVRSERAGIVRNILVENEDYVVIHQPLVEIEAT
jgi:acetyl-CoA carboxylase biotin carboxyl carrier protein